MLIAITEVAGYLEKLLDGPRGAGDAVVPTCGQFQKGEWNLDSDEL